MGYAIVSKPPLPYPSAAALRRTPFGRFRVNNHEHAAKHGKRKKRLFGSARFNSGHRRSLLGTHPSSPGCLSRRSATHHVSAHPKYPYRLSLFFSRLCWQLPVLMERDDILAYSAAEIGVLFTALTITEGSIWGRPTWGVWWTWDARLTLTAILLLIFVGYLMLRSLVEEENRAASSAAILGIIGFLDIPLIHMSVYWWRTLHQPPSILRPDKAPWENIQWPLLTPLLINVVAFFLFYFYLLSLRFRLGEITEEIKTRRMNRVD